MAIVHREIHRARAWMGTIWEEADKQAILQHVHKYVIISDDDHTEDGQLHWHCLIIHDDANERPKYTRTVHWEKVVNRTEARNYCLNKGPNYEEHGIFTINPANKQDWNGFKEACKTATKKELIDGPFSMLYAQYRSFAGEVHNQFKILPILKGDLDNLWLWGAPGTGKTKWAWENNKDMYIKAINKWWDGYNNEEVVLLDDWDPKHDPLVYYLKIWADRYPFRGECKGSSLMLRPKRIIVTSNYCIDACFEHPEDVMAIRRRFKCMHFIRFPEEPINE